MEVLFGPTDPTDQRRRKKDVDFGRVRLTTPVLPPERPELVE